MRILVTGGAGFIGSALVRHIIQNTNDTVINIDKLTYAGNVNSLKDVINSTRHIFIKADICDADNLSEIFASHQPDLVMHLAAESHVDRSISGSSEFIKTNIIGTYNLLECSRIYYDSLSSKQKNTFKFHHISTDEVYGDLKNEEELFTEDTPYSPSSPYSASKASSDHLVRAWQRTYNLPTIITNCSNNYGPFHFPEKLIPLTIINALSGNQIQIYGRGNQIRDWLYVTDHAEALYIVATKGIENSTYNIGGNNEYTNIDVVKKICSHLEDFAPDNPFSKKNTNGLGFQNLITHVDDRPGHDMRYAIDATKIKDHLNWKPKENFDTGLKKTILWFLKNEWWWQAIIDGSYKKNNDEIYQES